ncbi:PREDICTED: nucleoporin-62 C-terminal-like protein [Condylura cristata]|uniref:nucleoporin-62 C-terminal-like protein n=1 Tax=Condylura cristata TaxID=143302 RepID=UPI000642E18B|nr:PREDICTED: nucleoporin-62 C-terminal-like protein [Condylura cristata]
MLFTSMSNASASTVATGFSGTATSTTTTSTVTTTTTTITTSDFALNLKPPMQAGINDTDPANMASVPFTSTIDTVVTPMMTYGQLHGLLNKWNLELEDQEKYFLHHATQINAWDHLLIENGEKITVLDEEVEKVKQDQKRLEQELDFILSQQQELEDLLSPLEASLKDQNGSFSLQHTDGELKNTYKSAENIDAQLKQMTQDLKDIIEHLNSFGRSADASDPIQQICKILNAHMDSLQWIEENSGMLQRKVEAVIQVFVAHHCKEQNNVRIDFE